MVVSLVHLNAEHGSTGPHAGTDQCPGALEVHRADDGGLVRIRIPGGMLAAATLAELADWAEELGNGRMELTVRSNLQLRGIRAGAEAELADRLVAHGLLPSPAHDKARNVMASPLSGRDRVGTIDVRPLVGALDRALCATPALAELPGRFLFALDDGRGDVAGVRADLCVIGLPGDRVALLLGGHDTGLRLPTGSAVPALMEAAAAFLRHRPDQRTWRIAELPGGPLSLLEDLVRSVDAVRAEPLEVPVRDGRTPLGLIGQIDGLVALAVSVPLGELTAHRCRELAAAAHRCVVLMPGRGVLLPDLTPEMAAVAALDLTAAGLITDHGHPLLGVSACTGRPGCAKALADVRADAALVPTAIVPAAPAVTNGDQALAMHWSGCERRCGRPTGTVVDVVAELEGYQVFRDDQPVTAGADAASAHAAADRARCAR